MKVERLIYALAAASLALAGSAMAQDAPAKDATPQPEAPAQDTPTDQGDDAKKGDQPLDYDKYEKPSVPLPYVDSMGQGEANLILIPDPQFDERFWTPFMERNRDKYTMHAIVLPGTSGTQSFPVYYFNEPNRVGEGPAVKNAENAIVDYVVTNGLKNVYLVGDGIGGKMVFDLVADHPSLFQAGMSVNGQACHILACLTINITHEARANCAVNRVMPGFINREAPIWAQRNAMAVNSVIDDEARAMELSEVAAIQSKDVWATYYLESITRDVLPDLALNEVPLYFIVPVSEKGLPPKRTLQWWRDRNYYSLEGAKNAEIVYFEGAPSQKYPSENMPEAFDQAVADMVAGNQVKGIPSSGPDPDWQFNEDPGARERARNGGQRTPGDADTPANEAPQRRERERPSQR